MMLCQLLLSLGSLYATSCVVSQAQNHMLDHVMPGRNSCCDMSGAVHQTCIAGMMMWTVVLLV
jgi:hypothetical protein